MHAHTKTIKGLRQAKDLTQQEVADAAYIERSTYTKIENGAMPQVATAKRLGVLLGLSWTLFFDEGKRGRKNG